MARAGVRRDQRRVSSDRDPMACVVCEGKGILSVPTEDPPGWRPQGCPYCSGTGRAPYSPFCSQGSLTEITFEEDSAGTE